MAWISLASILALSAALIVSVTLLFRERRDMSRTKAQVDLLHKAIQAARAGVFYYRVMDNETYWDKNSLAMFGLEGEGRVIPPGTWERLIHPEDREKTLTQVIKALNGPDQLFTHTYRICLPDQQIRWIEGTGFVIRNEHRQPVKVTGFHFDITRQIDSEQTLKSSEIQARKAVEAKAQFLANMSHEIRTPMNAIIGVIELLNYETPTAGQKRYLNTLQNSSDVLLRIINDVLDVSKLEAGKLTLEDRPFPVRDVLQQCLSVYTQISDQKDILLTGRVDARIPVYMNGDSARLQQVLMNLIGNAFKFTESGHILIRVTATDGHWLRFSVEDSGIGIEASARERLFERFNQIDKSTSRKFGGTGLGLTIVRDIVELWGGQVSVQSEPGRGSEFVFELPNLRPMRELSRPAERFLLCSHHETFARLWQEDPLAPDLTWVRDADSFETALRHEHVSFDHLVVEERFCDTDCRPLVDMARALCPELTTTLIGSDANVQGDNIHDGFDHYAPHPMIINQVWDRQLWQGLKTDDTPEYPDYSHLRVLCVDDNQSNLMVLAGLLKHLGVHANCVSSGQEAIKAVGKENFDLILMDYEMPDLDGPSTARIILQHNPILILALSAHTGEHFQRIAEDAGMQGFVHKPIRLNALSNMLGKHFSASSNAKPETAEPHVQAAKVKH